MTNAGATSSKNSNGNVDENQRDVVGGPVFKKIKTRPLIKRNIRLPINSINKFNYHFGRSNL